MRKTVLITGCSSGFGKATAQLFLDKGMTAVPYRCEPSGRSDTTSIVGSAIGAIIRLGFRSSVPLANTYLIPAYNVLDFRAGVEAADGCSSA